MDWQGAILVIMAVICFGWLIGRMVQVVIQTRKEKPVKHAKKNGLINKLQEEDFEWFIEHYKELYKKYGVTYIAISNKKIIGTYQSYAEGVYRAQELGYKLGTFIVQYCNGDESGYTSYVYHSEVK